jgi:U3 small nucleolar RNA-associated protein 4
VCADGATKQYHSLLPSVGMPPSCIAFVPSSPSTLVVGLPDNTFEVFSVESGRIEEWARGGLAAAASSSTSSSSKTARSRLRKLRDPLIGMTFVEPDDVGDGGGRRNNTSVAGGRRPRETILAWSASWVCKVPLVPDSTMGQNGVVAATRASKRKRNADDRSNGTAGKGQPNDDDDEDEDDEDVATAGEKWTSRKYRDLLFVGSLGPGELVVVERPFFDMLPNLPKAWVGKGKYGR